MVAVVVDGAVLVVDAANQDGVNSFHIVKSGERLATSGLLFLGSSRSISLQ
jgi:hypothetical protein